MWKWRSEEGRADSREWWGESQQNRWVRNTPVCLFNYSNQYIITSIYFISSQTGKVPVFSAYKQQKGRKRWETVGLYNDFLKLFLFLLVCLPADSDPVANCSGGEQEDRLWRSLYRRMLGNHCSSLCQVVLSSKWRCMIMQSKCVYHNGLHIRF